MPSWPLLRLSFASEREAEGVEQGSPLGIGTGGGDDGDVHAPGRVDLVVVDLGEDELLGDTERVVAASVEAGRREAAEVADAGDGEADEPVEELPHAIASQRDLRPDAVALAQLEAGDGLGGLGDERLLSGDDGEVGDRSLDRKSTRLNSSHVEISYAVFCLKKKT